MIQQTFLVSAVIVILFSALASPQTPIQPLRVEKEPFDQDRINIETFRFYDWKVATNQQNSERQQCHLSLQGVSRHRVFISMRLSMVASEDRSQQEQVSGQDKNDRHSGLRKDKPLTILKVSANQRDPVTPNKNSALYIDSAWLETTNTSTLEKIDKADQTSAHFLGGHPGIGLFLSLLKGIKQEGLIIGIRSREHKRAKLFHAPPPKADIFSQLRPCFEKRVTQKKL